MPATETVGTTTAPREPRPNPAAPGPAATEAKAPTAATIIPSTVRDSATSFLLPDDRFKEMLTLDEYVADAVEETLADKLATAIEENVGNALAEARRRGSGVVFASNAVIGLAAARLIGGRAMWVPLTAAEKCLSRASVAAELSSKRPTPDDLEDFLARRSSGDAPILIRAWNSPPARLQEEVAEARQSKGLAGKRLIWLARREPGQTLVGEEPLLDLADRAAHILARVIQLLLLPRYEPVVSFEAAQRQIQRLRGDLGHSEDKIVDALNHPEHIRYDTLASGADVVEYPVLAERLRRYLHSRSENGGTECDRPIHAASLFVVGHFNEIRPDHFMELADLLAAHTPIDHAGSVDRREPAHVTDRILQDCGIQVRNRGRAGRIVTISEAAADELAPPDGGTDIRYARSLQRQFETFGSALKERYLAALAADLTLGHAADSVATQYADIEIAAMADIGALNEEAAGHRLARVVFGYPAFQRAQEGYVDANLPRLEAALRRSIRRAPALVREVAQRTGLPLKALVAPLCRVEPVDADPRWLGAFRFGCGRLFWALYAHDPEGVTLESFPGLFATDLEASQRREVMLTVLSSLLQDEAGDELHRDCVRRFYDPALVARLLYEIALRFDDLTPRAGDARGCLLVDVASYYLLLTARSPSLADAPSWPAEIAEVGEEAADWLLAKALLSADAASVLRPSGNWPEDKQERVVALDAAGRRVWLACRVTLAALLGSAALGDLESDVLHIWLMEQIGVDPDDVEPLFNHRGLWQRYCDLEADEDFDRSFRRVVGRLLELFPIAVLLNVTRRSRKVSFSPAMREWLGERGQDKGSAAVVAALGRRLDTVRTTFVDGWTEMFRRWSAPTGLREAARVACKERMNLLGELRQLLQAIARERRGLHRAAGVGVETINQNAGS